MTYKLVSAIIIAALFALVVFGYFKWNPKDYAYRLEELAKKQKELDSLYSISLHKADSLKKVIVFQDVRIAHLDSLNKSNRNELIRIKKDLRNLLAGVDTLDAIELYNALTGSLGVR